MNIREALFKYMIKNYCTWIGIRNISIWSTSDECRRYI